MKNLFNKILQTPNQLVIFHNSIFSALQRKKQRIQISYKIAPIHRSSSPLAAFFLKKSIPFGNRGLTLIELMVVIAIMGVLASIAVPNYNSYIDRVKKTSMVDTMRKIETEILLFHLEHGRFPNDLKEVGLDTLVDSWGNPFQYLNIADATKKIKPRKDHKLHPINTDFDLYSMGPDEKSNIPLTAKASRDDIIRANNGGFWGVASDY